MGLLVFSFIAHGDDTAHSNQQVFQRAHGQTVSHRASFVNDFSNGVALIARLPLLNKITVLQNPTSVEKERNLIGGSDGFNRLKICQRYRMPAARVYAQLDVDA